MSKTKLRCMTCGKWFQSANAREVTCPDCAQKARKEKQAQKNAPPPVVKPAGSGTPTAAVRPPAPQKPKTTASGTIQWLDKISDVKIAQPDQPAPKPKIATPPVHRENANGTGGRSNGSDSGSGDQRGTGPARGPAAYRGNNAGAGPTIGQRPQPPRQPMEGPGGGPSKPWQKNNGAPGSRPQPGGPKPRGKPKVKVPAPPKPKKEKTPPPAPFVPTAEQIQQVEERYTILAQPAEFDGIRTQIAKEVGIPKKSVKKIIKDFRDQQHIPSWWELQTYKGSSEELDKIKAVYLPYLPVPPVGVHKKIADILTIKPGIVYQAIKTIRLEMDLPQYNDPDLHAEELKQKASERLAQATSNEEKPTIAIVETAANEETIVLQVETTTEEEPTTAVVETANEKATIVQPEQSEQSEQPEQVTEHE
jgi:predicted  nucleic acid-binding Zn-ribbon protein